MEVSELIPHIESLIFASDKPLTSAEIAELMNAAFGFMEEKIAPEQIDACIEGVVGKYASEFYPFEVRQSGGGWQFLTKKEFHKTVAQLNGEKFLKRLSSAALETLAIIAYKQPVTKGEIESIRGVSTDYAIQKLLEKELVVITGRNEKMPGHPLVYATSKSFMDYFGINSPEDLPKIREVLTEGMVSPTVVNSLDVEQSELAVSDEGELVLSETGESDAGSEVEATDEDREDDLTPHTNDTETIVDEQAVEDAITDEIFAAEDEAVEAEKLEEELAGDDDILPEDEEPAESDPEDLDDEDDEEKTDGPTA